MRAETRSRPMFLPLLILAMIITAVFYLTAQPPATPSTAFEPVNAYRDLPLSKHAEISHAKEKWNAQSIQTFFANKGCKPRITLCEADDFEIHSCRVNGGKSIALVIGHTVRQIITGYMDDTSVWENKCPTLMN